MDDETARGAGAQAGGGDAGGRPPADQRPRDAEETPTEKLSQTAPASEPPPPSVQPRLVRSRRDNDGRSNAWWIILALLLIAAAVVAALWYFMFRDGGEATPATSPSPSQVSWAGAWARTDGMGGGLVIEGAADTYLVTPYDGALRGGETVSATADAGGSELSFTLPAQFSLAGPAGPLAVLLVAGDDPDTATLDITGADGTTLSLPLERVASLTPSRPLSPSPAPSDPGPVPTRSPTSSPSAGRSGDERMIIAVESIQAGIEQWSTVNDGLYPTPADVRPTGEVAAYIDPWPDNPWAPNEPLSPGTEPGNFTYEQLNGGLHYRLTGHLDNGAFVVP